MAVIDFLQGQLNIFLKCFLNILIITLNAYRLGIYKIKFLQKPENKGFKKIIFMKGSNST